MTKIAQSHVSRRSVLGAAAATGGLALGVGAGGITKVLAQKVLSESNGSQEVGAWVVIAPDDQVTIRIAASNLRACGVPRLSRWQRSFEPPPKTPQPAVSGLKDSW